VRPQLQRCKPTRQPQANFEISSLYGYFDSVRRRIYRLKGSPIAAQFTSSIFVGHPRQKVHVDGKDYQV
jgi:hypothetical protein